MQDTVFEPHVKRSKLGISESNLRTYFSFWVPNVLVLEYRAFRVHPRDRARGFGKNYVIDSSSIRFSRFSIIFPKKKHEKKKNDHPRSAGELP